MILKIIHCYDQQTHSIFYDGFDNVKVSYCNEFKKENISCVHPCAIYNLFDKKLTTAIKLELCNKDNIIHRVIYIDPLIRTKLMSNEGKTIERIS